MSTSALEEPPLPGASAAPRLCRSEEHKWLLLSFVKGFVINLEKLHWKYISPLSLQDFH